MALTTRVWSAGKLLVLAGALVATYVAVCGGLHAPGAARERGARFLISRTARRTKPATAASALGLALKVDDAKRTDPKIAAGRILAQEPAAGSTARRQRTVRVWVSAGPARDDRARRDRRNRADRAAAADAERLRA